MIFGKKNKKLFIPTKDAEGKTTGYEEETKTVDMSPEELVKDMYDKMCDMCGTEKGPDMSTKDMAKAVHDKLSELKPTEDMEAETVDMAEEKTEDMKEETKDAEAVEKTKTVADMEIEVAKMKDGKVKDAAIEVLKGLKGITKSEESTSDKIASKKVLDSTETKKEIPVISARALDNYLMGK